ncbi:META domain-containing protein [Rikenella microfusus]|uniref:META domain n=1 Tax=Rikenella microfusus TaxID=28139 RepID=A0A379MPK6_9BACT|nr:META domain-containing protein [Rikenella microfusus]SUE33558.1 META domain [Rikenella microfusus]HJE87451.1 META domain-containing protein [Rikenella microfusus]
MLRIATAILAALSVTACTGVGESPLVLESDLWVALGSADSSGSRATDSTGSESPPSVEFLSDGQLQGFTSCNTFFGSYTTKETDSVSQITITIEGMTLALCPDDVREQDYVEKLRNARRYTVRHRQLLLMDSTGTVVLTFVPASTIQKR